jgi:hypothetical protein
MIHEIDIHLHAAHIILLLISANFLASEYCVSREMMRALERHERGEAHVIPVLLRPVLITDAPFAKLQPLPTNGKPVTRWKDRDLAFYNIAQGIEWLVLSLRAPSAVPPSPAEPESPPVTSASRWAAVNFGIPWAKIRYFRKPIHLMPVSDMVF